MSHENDILGSGLFYCHTSRFSMSKILFVNDLYTEAGFSRNLHGLITRRRINN